jgi:hypothetical protein
MSGSGTSRTSGDVRLESAKWAKADIESGRAHLATRRHLVEKLLEQATQLKRRPLAAVRQQRHGSIGGTIDAPAGDRRRGSNQARRQQLKGVVRPAGGSIQNDSGLPQGPAGASGAC